VPLALPQTQLRRADSIVVTSVKLLLGQRLRLGWLGLKLLKVGTGAQNRLNTSLGTAYVGVYAGGFDALRQPSGTPIYVLSATGPLTRQLTPYAWREFSGPDVIEVVAINNTGNVDVELAVMGAMRLL
jgi:hypothetical protein